MNLNWFESLLYGIVSGLADFLPISSSAHQELMIKIFGMDAREPVLDLFVHLSILAALVFATRTVFEQFRRENVRTRRGKRTTYQSGKVSASVQFVKNAVVPMILGLLIFFFVFKSSASLLTSAIFLILNGIILYAPERMMHGNKDGRSMSLWDSILFGVSASLSGCPGLSRVAVASTYATARGASRQNILQWILLLSVPALGTQVILDFVAIFASAGNVAFWSNFFCYLLSSLGAFSGGYMGIVLLRFLSVRTGYSGFAFYSWGAALLSFLIYLLIA